jgi:hypothetical protein
MHSVLVTVSAKLFQLQAGRGVATVFFGGVARNPIRTLIGVTAALCALYGNDETNAFGHDS